MKEKTVTDIYHVIQHCCYMTGGFKNEFQLKNT